MGTSKNGRYLNTKGSGRSVSDFALVHSDEGKYTKPSRKGDKLRLVSGGHGQTGMDQLDKYGIKYNVEKTYSNGVRVGNIPNHKTQTREKVWDKRGFQNHGLLRTSATQENTWRG